MSLVVNDGFNFNQTLSDCLELFRFRNSVHKQNSSSFIILLSGNKSSVAAKQELLCTVARLFETILLQPSITIPEQIIRQVKELTPYVHHFIQSDADLFLMPEAQYLDDWMLTNPHITRYTQHSLSCSTQPLEIQRILKEPTLSHTENRNLLVALTLFVHTQKYLIYVRDTIELCKRTETLRKNYLQEKFLCIASSPSGSCSILNIDGITDIEDIRIFIFAAKMRKLGFPEKERQQSWYPFFQKITKSSRSQEIKERCYKGLDFTGTDALYHQTLNKYRNEDFANTFQKYFSQAFRDQTIRALEEIAKVATKAANTKLSFLHWLREKIPSNTQDLVEHYLIIKAEKLTIFSHEFQKAINKYFAIGNIKALYQQIFQKAVSTKEFPKNKLLSPEEFAKEADLLAAPLPAIPSITKTLLQAEEEDVMRLTQAMKYFNISESQKQPVAPKKTKTKRPPQKTAAPSGYAYHPRVIRWWSRDPSIDPFLNDPKYMSCQPETQKRIRSEHAFALAVDKYVESEGIGNREEQKTLIGEMIMHDGQKRRGIFGYAFDKNKTCYHRHFTEKVTTELYGQLLDQGFYQLDFPPLTAKETKQTADKHVAHDGSYVELETEEIVIIKNTSDNTTIRLCRFS